MFLGPEITQLALWALILTLAGICQSHWCRHRSAAVRHVFISIKDEDKPAFIEICRSCQGRFSTQLAAPPPHYRPPVHQQHASPGDGRVPRRCHGMLPGNTQPAFPRPKASANKDFSAPYGVDHCASRTTVAAAVPLPLPGLRRGLKPTLQKYLAILADG